MITLEQVREHLLSQPQVEETTHFRRPAFAVDGTDFASLDRDGTHLALRLDRAAADDAVAEDHVTYELVWRGSSTFLGLRIKLATADPERVRLLLDASLQHMSESTSK